MLCNMLCKQPKNPEESQKNPVYTLLVAGHREDRLGEVNTDNLKQVMTEQILGIRQALVTSNNGKDDEPDKRFRIITGSSKGCDELTVSIAKENCIILHQLTVDKPKADDKAVQVYIREPVIGATEQADTQPDTQPDEKLYQLRDEFALSFSDVLLVVWDGKAPRGGAGTVRLVFKAISMGMPVVWINPCNNEVKQSKAMVKNNHGEKVLPPDFAAENLLFNGPNADLKALQSRFVEWSPGNQYDDIVKMLDRLKSIPSEDMVTAKNSASKESAQMQFRHVASIYATYLLSVFAVLFALVGQVADEHLSWLWGGLELVALVGVLFTVWIAKKKNWHGEWIKSRFRAEQLRYAPSYAKVGMVPWLLQQPLSGKVNSEIIRVHRAWKQSGLSSIKMNVGEEEQKRCLSDPALVKDRRKDVAKAVLEQIYYHKTKHEETEGKHSCIENNHIWLFGLTVIVVVVHTLAQVFAHEQTNELLMRISGVEEQKVGVLWLFVTALVPVLAAALKGLDDKRAFAHDAKRSESTKRELEQIFVALGTQDVLKDLSKDFDTKAKEHESQSTSVDSHENLAGRLLESVKAVLYGIGHFIPDLPMLCLLKSMLTGKRLLTSATKQKEAGKKTEWCENHFKDRIKGPNEDQKNSELNETQKINAWLELRLLTAEASAIMSDENQVWQEILELNAAELT